MSGRKGDPLKIGSVVIDCNDFDKMSTFWQEALRYVPRDPPEEDWVILPRSTQGGRQCVSTTGARGAHTGKNRLHLDLYTDDQQAEVDRLLRIGATRHPRIPEADEDFIVLEDPEGNLFCVIDVAK